MTDLFNDDTNPLADLVGEDKKFKSVEDLAKGKLEADRFVERLTQEQQEARDTIAKLQAELDKRTNLEEVLDRLESRERSPNADDTRREQETPKPAIKPEDIDRLLDQKLAKAEATRKANENIRTVKKTLADTLGQDYAAKLRDKATELEMTPEKLNELAASNPTAFFKLIGVDQKKEVERPNLPPENQRNTTDFKPNAGETRNNAYYSNLRREKGENFYFTPKVQLQLWKDLTEMGEAKFYE